MGKPFCQACNDQCYKRVQRLYALATQNGSGGLGVHITSGLQVDHIDSSSGGGIYFFDNITTTSTYPFETQNNVLDDGSGNMNLVGNLTIKNTLPTITLQNATDDTFEIQSTDSGTVAIIIGGTQVMHIGASGNMTITGKLTQSGCLAKDMALDDVTNYLIDCQDKKMRETQTEVDALERLVLWQHKIIGQLQPSRQSRRSLQKIRQKSQAIPRSSRHEAA